MEKIKQFIEKIKEKCRQICDTIKNIKSNIDFYKDLWDRPQGKAAVQKVIEQLWYLLQKVKPKKIEGDVQFGTGDPASTGQILGGVAAVYGFIPEKLVLRPDFEKKILEGNLNVKGRIRLIHVLIIAVKLIADKNVRYIFRKIQAREDAKNE